MSSPGAAAKATIPKRKRKSRWEQHAEDDGGEREATKKTFNNNNNNNNAFQGKDIGLPPGMGLVAVEQQQQQQQRNNTTLSVDLDPTKILAHLAAKGFVSGSGDAGETSTLNGLKRTPHPNPVIEDHYKRFLRFKRQVTETRLPRPATGARAVAESASEVR